MIQKFTRNQRGLELIPDILKSLEVHFLRMVCSLEREGPGNPQPTLLSLPPLPRRCLALIVDILPPLLPYKQLREIITIHNLVERTLKMIFQQTLHPLFYSLGVDLVKAVVAAGYVSTLITERYSFNPFPLSSFSPLPLFSSPSASFCLFVYLFIFADLLVISDGR